MNRDQSVIIYGGLSSKRFDQYYNPLLIFDQIFSGGVSGNMNSKLFSLREKNGFFYSIGGSIISGCSEHQGMILIKAITSKDLVEKSIKLINEKIKNSLFGINEEDLKDAKKIIQYYFFDLVSNYKSIASTILFMHRYNLNKDFLKLRFSEIENVKMIDIEKSVKEFLDLNKLICLTVGR